MPKFQVKLSRRAYMSADLSVEADTIEEAREKTKEFLLQRSSQGVKDSSEQEVESIYDLEWKYVELDPTDETEILKINK